MPGVEKSQRFPFINLEKAIDRAKTLYTNDNCGGDIPIAAVFELWGYSGKSSGGFQTISALKHYDLMTQVGQACRLTKSALIYFRDERNEVRKEALQSFAIAPSLFAQLWSDWKDKPPSDTVARSHLKVTLGFNEQSARSILGIYKANISFAEPKADVKIPERRLNADHAEDDHDAPPIIVGQYVGQWTSGGVDQFSEPKQVTWVSEDGTHLRVFGSMTGIPMNEVTLADPPPAKSTTAPAGPTKATNEGATADAVSVLQSGGRLQITADVDLVGLSKLREALGKYEELLKLLS